MGLINHHNNLSISSNISAECVSFSILINNRLAIAEASVFPPQIAQEVIQDSAITEQEKQELTKLLSSSDKVFFFNRLNVPKEINNNGYGTALLNKLIEHIDSNNYFLINTANAYGDKSQEELIKFYQKNGMKLIAQEGLLVYHKRIAKPLVKSNLNKP